MEKKISVIFKIYFGIILQKKIQKIAWKWLKYKKSQEK